MTLYQSSGKGNGARLNSRISTQTTNGTTTYGNIYLHHRPAFQKLEQTGLPIDPAIRSKKKTGIINRNLRKIYARRPVL